MKKQADFFSSMLFKINARLFALCLLFFTFYTEGVAQCGCTDCRCADSLELVKLYQATDSTWTNKTGWQWADRRAMPMDNWFGVSLENGRVTQINLQNNNLTGILPNLNLSNLQDLHLRANRLGGNIPDFNFLPNLQSLDLSNNRLDSTIPNLNLPLLRWLYLYNNKLTGTIPYFNLPDLRVLSLHSNQLKDTIPSFNLRKLQNLFLHNNTLSGCIPQAIRTQCPLIREIGGNVSNNPNLATQNWANYWNNGEGACQDTTTCRYKDSLALIALYDATNGPNWRKKTNWKSNRPLNEWYGIYTNTEGCVTCIDLDGTVNYTWSMDSLGNNLQGRLPDSLGNGNMTKLERLIVNGNQGLSNILPPNFGKMPELLAFWANDCRFTTPFPNSFFTTPKLEDIDLTNNPLNTVPPSGFSLMPKLSGLVLINCGLYDKIPVSWSGKLWRRVQLENNKIDSFPNLSSFSNAPGCNCNDSLFSFQNNRATFDDIVPTLTNWRQIIPIVYYPQDFFYVDTTFRRNVGETLSINLGIDGALTTNKYVWFKNGIRFDSSNQNTFILRGLIPCDAGTYTCQVTNTLAPFLTLKSRTITVTVTGNVPTQTKDTTLCFGKTYQLPTGRIVSTAGNYTIDTLRSVRRCDSLIRVVNLILNRGTTAPPIAKTLCPKDSFQLPLSRKWLKTAGTFNDTTRNQFGCDSIIPYQIGFQQQPDAVDDALEIPQNTTESVIDVLKNDRYPTNLIDILIRRQLPVGTLEVQSLGIYNVKMPRILKNPISFSYQICSKTCPNLCDSATVTITMKGETTLGKIQTLITPNGDGKNDVLDFPEIDWSKYPNNEMEIFNRWGQRIYYAKPYNTHRWEGKNEQGLELPEGDYFLILRLGLAEGNILVGTVYLQR